MDCARTARVLLIVLLAAGCGREEAPPPPLPVVVVAPVESVHLLEQIAATGELQAMEHAEIAAEVSGQITELLKREGEPVEAGEVVLRIDPERRQLEVETARAGVAEARSALREARRELDRVTRMQKRGAASAAQLDSASARLEATQSHLMAAEAQLGVAERALADAEVRAPYAGVVARRAVSVGEFVTPGKPLFELVAMQPLEVVFAVSERDSARVQRGREVEVRVASYPEEVFRGAVETISPVIDERSRTLRVKARLDNADGRLRPGLFARVELGVREREGVPMVPEEAVMQRASGPSVFVLVEGARIERREIATGTHREGRVEISRGLSHGEWVISQGQMRLVDGMKVQPQLADGSPWPDGLARLDPADRATP